MDTDVPQKGPSASARLSHSDLSLSLGCNVDPEDPEIGEETLISSRQMRAYSPDYGPSTIDNSTPIQGDEQSAGPSTIGKSLVDFWSVNFFDQRESLLASGSTSAATESHTLVATSQAEFILDALPTLRGRIKRTRDMAEIYGCNCGETVESDAQIQGSETAMRCGFNGCETPWVCCQN